LHSFRKLRRYFRVADDLLHLDVPVHHLVRLLLHSVCGKDYLAHQLMALQYVADNFLFLHFAVDEMMQGVQQIQDELNQDVDQTYQDVDHRHLHQQVVVVVAALMILQRKDYFQDVELADVEFQMDYFQDVVQQDVRQFPMAQVMAEALALRDVRLLLLFEQ